MNNLLSQLKKLNADLDALTLEYEAILEPWKRPRWIARAQEPQVQCDGTSETTPENAQCPDESCLESYLDNVIQKASEIRIRNCAIETEEATEIEELSILADETLKHREVVEKAEKKRLLALKPHKPLPQPSKREIAKAYKPPPLPKQKHFQTTYGSTFRPSSKKTPRPSTSRSTYSDATVSTSNRSLKSDTRSQPTNHKLQRNPQNQSQPKTPKEVVSSAPANAMTQNAVAQSLDDKESADGGLHETDDCGNRVPLTHELPSVLAHASPAGQTKTGGISDGANHVPEVLLSSVDPRSPEFLLHNPIPTEIEWYWKKVCRLIKRIHEADAANAQHRDDTLRKFSDGRFGVDVTGLRSDLEVLDEIEQDILRCSNDPELYSTKTEIWRQCLSGISKGSIETDFTEFEDLNRLESLLTSQNTLPTIYHSKSGKQLIQEADMKSNKLYNIHQIHVQLRVSSILDEMLEKPAHLVDIDQLKFLYSCVYTDGRSLPAFVVND